MTSSSQALQIYEKYYTDVTADYGPSSVTVTDVREDQDKIYVMFTLNNAHGLMEGVPYTGVFAVDKADSETISMSAGSGGSEWAVPKNAVSIPFTVPQ